MEVTKADKSQMFRDRREGDRRTKEGSSNEDIRQTQERRNSERRNNKDFNDAPWWLQRAYLDESLDKDGGNSLLEQLADGISVKYH